MDVQDMLAETEHPVVNLTEILKVFGRDRDTLFCFYEGKDHAYYGGRIRYCHDCSISVHPCVGKANVINAARYLDSRPRLDKARCMYFVDRDFDGLTYSKPWCYQTPCYSIENLYVTPDAFQEVLRVHCEMYHSDDIDECVKRYEQTLAIFHEKILPVNAWAYVKRQAALAGKQVNGSLRKIKVFDHLSIQIDNVEGEWSLEMLNQGLDDADKVSAAEHDHALDSLSGVQPSCAAFRGKFEFDFFVKYLNVLRSIVSQDCEYLTKKYRCPTFGGKKALVDLSNTAITPKCLKTFLTTCHSHCCHLTGT